MERKTGEGGSFTALVIPQEVIHTKDHAMVHHSVTVAGARSEAEHRQIVQTAADAVAGLTGASSVKIVQEKSNGGNKQFGFGNWSGSKWQPEGPGIQGGYKPEDKYPSPSSKNPSSN